MLVSDGRGPQPRDVLRLALRGEGSSAPLRASVPVLPAAVLPADLGASLRCGTTALRLALDSVCAGSVAGALVAAADMRPVAPGGELEPLVGEGAGAALVGADG